MNITEDSENLAPEPPAPSPQADGDQGDHDAIDARLEACRSGERCDD